ncbi:NADPH-Fe(3+) oxidoreductase subunit alpha [bacterium HR29]|nr:NADPH-Fe(3+) oxidoreductase subunit alpha [bacterium HR29]
MAKITVNGRVIEAPDGAVLLEVLKENGFYVSSLCYIPGLKPYAGCRTCLVDVEGPPGLQLSCTTTVQDGMVVRTDTEEIRAARKAVTSIILANHSDRCLTCHRREHCHPGDICLRDDVVTHRCLTCSKNYRCELQATCEKVEMAGYEPWVGEERSWYATAHPEADRANPFLEFDPQMCIICTRCQRACNEIRHTGAITLSGKGWDTRIAFGAGGPIHESNCDFCGACIDVCPTAALMEHPNKWVAKPDRWTTTTCDSCAIGCSIRLGTKEGRGVIVRPGVGNPVSGNQICVRGRFHYASLKPRERLGRHLVRRGTILAPSNYADAVAEAARHLRQARERGRVAVLVGGTATNEEALLARIVAREAFGTEATTALAPVLRAVAGALEARFGTARMAGNLEALAKAKTVVVVHDDIEESHNIASLRVKDAAVAGARLVVIGALRSELCDFAAAWVRPAPNEEGWAAARLAELLLGGADEAAFADALAALRGADPESTMVLVAPNPVSPGKAAAMAAGAANLAIALCGERASEHLVVLPPEANAHGLLDLGLAANEPDWEGLAGLLVFRDDPTLTVPAAATALRPECAVVVIDGLLHETAKAASVVIAEGRAYAAEGTYTAADFRVQRLAPAVRPEGEAVRGFEALRALAEALGVSVPATPEEALLQIAAERPDYMPAADLIVGEGIRLDVSRAPKAAVVPLAEPPAAAAGTLRLISSRDLYTALDAAALRHPEAEKLHRYDRVRLAPADMARLAVREGDVVEVTDGRLTVTAPVAADERVPEGAVYLSSLMAGGIAAAFFAASPMPTVRIGAPVTA